MSAVGIFLTLASLTAGTDEGPMISPASNEHGIAVHNVESSLQEGTTQIRVLLPDALRAEKKYRAIYVLPVEARNETRYGDGLAEVKKHDLQNKFQTIFIGPTFSHLPWYADHPTNRTTRQETYFLDVVLPFVEKAYPVDSRPDSRLLLGFSKSGWGAYSLLLRHLDVFNRAVAWDAPLMMDQPGKYGSMPVFGTPDNFEKYRITSLLRTNAESLGPSPRLVIMGYGNFRREHEQLHSLMTELQVPHWYRDGPQRQHDWHSGWVEEAVALLLDNPNGR
jgi:hypothetical protein